MYTKLFKYGELQNDASLPLKEQNETRISSTSLESVSTTCFQVLLFVGVPF